MPARRVLAVPPGDTDFSLTQHLDRWTDQGVRFVFGYDASQAMISRAQGLPDDEFDELIRKAEQALASEPRAKQQRVKQGIVVEREFLDLVLESEEIAELASRHGSRCACRCRPAAATSTRPSVSSS